MEVDSPDEVELLIMTDMMREVEEANDELEGMKESPGNSSSSILRD